MADSTRSFLLASEAEVEKKNAVYSDIEYEFTDPDALDEKQRPTVRTVIAKYPGEGAVFNMAATVGQFDIHGQNTAGALMTFLRLSLSHEDYEWLNRQLVLSRLTQELLRSMVTDMVKEWTAFPTK